MRSGHNKNYNNNTHQKKKKQSPLMIHSEVLSSGFFWVNPNGAGSQNLTLQEQLFVTSQHTHYILFIVIYLALQKSYLKLSITPVY